MAALELRLSREGVILEAVRDGNEDERLRGEDAARVQLRLDNADPDVDEVIGEYERLHRES